MDRITELTRTLALVRPVGMGDDMASDWIAAAAAETMDLSDAIFAEGCQTARRECTHHGQIVPVLRRANAGVVEYRRMLDNANKRFLADHNPPAKQLSHRGEVKRIGQVTGLGNWDDG